MDISDSLTQDFAAKKVKPTLYKSSTVVGFFFDKHPTLENRWVCKNCRGVKACNVKESYTNLRVHCSSCFGIDYESIITQHLIDTKSVIGSYGKITRTLMTGDSGFKVYTQRQKECYRWIKVIIVNIFALSMCENIHLSELAGCFNGGNTFCVKSMRKYILALCLLVEKEIAKALSDKPLAVMFDGWEHRRRKYIGLFASYEEENTGYEEVMLAIQPTLEADENGTADAHVDLIQSTLQMYEVDVTKQLVCLGADNTITNPSVAQKMGVPLIGCASHKFNLGVQDWIDSDDELAQAIASLADLMKQASYSKAASLLRDFTIAKQQCVTRWTGTMDMIQRYFRIKPELEKIQDLRKFFLSKQDDRCLTGAARSLDTLKIVTKELQHKGITLMEVRDLFNAVLEDDRFEDCFRRTIGEDSTLIKNPVFESGILRLTADPNTTLQSREAEACKKLLIPSEEEEEDENDEPVSR